MKTIRLLVTDKRDTAPFNKEKQEADIWIHDGKVAKNRFGPVFPSAEEWFRDFIGVPPPKVNIKFPEGPHGEVLEKVVMAAISERDTKIKALEKKNETLKSELKIEKNSRQSDVDDLQQKLQAARTAESGAIKQFSDMVKRVQELEIDLEDAKEQANVAEGERDLAREREQDLRDNELESFREDILSLEEERDALEKERDEAVKSLEKKTDEVDRFYEDAIKKIDAARDAGLEWNGIEEKWVKIDA